MSFFLGTVPPILIALSYMIICPLDAYVRIKLQKEEIDSNS